MKLTLLTTTFLLPLCFGSAYGQSPQPQEQAQQLNDCAAHAPRQSVVYVDDTDMIKSDTIWILTLAFKLTASMMPGEKLAIVQMSPSQGTSKQIWQGCWPKSSANGGNSIDVLKQQIAFSQQVNDSVTKILNATGRTLQDSMIDGQKPPQKQIIKSLVSDIDRYQKTSQPTVRAIIYSDMAENSDLGSAFSQSTNDVFVNKLGVYFVHGVFYAFGLGKTVYNVQDYNVNAIRFWNNAFKAMSGITESISPDFDIPQVVPQNGSYFDVNLQYEGEQLSGKMALLIDKDGNLIDSWIGISHLTGAGLRGTLLCLKEGTCKLTAKTNGGLVGYGDHENLEMLVNVNATLSGFISVDKPNQFYVDGNKVGF